MNGPLRLNHADSFRSEQTLRWDEAGAFRLDQVLKCERRYITSCVNGAPWLAAYPEGTVGDADSPPGDGDGVFEGGGGRVGAQVEPVAFTPDLHLHREPLCLLMDEHKDTKLNVFKPFYGFKPLKGLQKVLLQVNS